VEIGSYDLLDGVVCQGQSRLVNPGIPIPPKMSAIHHLIDEDVAGYPPWPTALLPIVDRPVDAFCAHNAAFEKMWLTPNLTGAAPWVCSYRCAMRVWPEAPGHSNQELRYWLKPEGLSRALAEPSHRAKPDAYVTAFTLRELLKRATLAQLIEWSSKPALLPRLNFGKHKGTAWAEVDHSYLQWIIKQSDMGEDVVFTAKHWLGESFRRAGGRPKPQEPAAVVPEPAQKGFV
jgi:exodeoxyribonuclease X